eukprot:15457443-Alexandrium_andersonii.AAC.1
MLRLLASCCIVRGIFLVRSLSAFGRPRTALSVRLVRHVVAPVAFGDGLGPSSLAASRLDVDVPQRPACA